MDEKLQIKYYKFGIKSSQSFHSQQIVNFLEPHGFSFQL